MIITKFVDIKMGYWNVKYYTSLEYSVKFNDVITIPINMLPKGSHVKIEIICDYCGKKFFRNYKDVLKLKQKQINPKDCCKKCIGVKCKETNMILYGVDSPMKREEIKKKLKKTNLEKYGFEYPVQSDTVKQKIAQKASAKTCEEIKNIVAKRRKTMMEKYGVQCGLQLEKCKDNLFKAGTLSSSQQDFIYDVVEKEYGNNNVSLNFPYSNLHLDMLIFINNIKIDVEYDSWYWHEFKRDRKRDEFLKSRGFKILRIKSGKKIPSKKILFEKINELAITNLVYSEIILDDWDEKEYKEGGHR